ncbi:MAG TPA: DMT family transporter, partial [Planctomycetota bacterium]|nr:DMT family transporter [Planctomycetota bacterium]
MFSAIADPSLGALAATATAFCWAVGALFFTSASRRIGQFKVNQIRLVMAIVLLVAACAFTGAFGALPLGQAALLALSGFAGLTLGDAAYFFALQTIGPRRGALVLSLHPIFAAWLGFWLLGEAMTWVGVCGMALTL